MKFDVLRVTTRPLGTVIEVDNDGQATDGTEWELKLLASDGTADMTIVTTNDAIAKSIGKTGVTVEVAIGARPERDADDAMKWRDLVRALAPICRDVGDRK